MEKMRPLDGKLKHQVDRLVQLAELSPQDLSQHTDLLRPNPFALLSSSTGGGDEKSAKGKGASKKSSKKASKMDYSDDEDEDEGEGSESEVEDDSEGESEAKTDGLYKVPKRTAVPYKESESALDRREKRVEKAKSKLKRSELMDTLREEFGSAPEAAASSGLGMQSGDLRKLQDEAEERRQFEEERFVRMVSIPRRRYLLNFLLFVTKCFFLIFIIYVDDEQERQERHQAAHCRGVQAG